MLDKMVEDNLRMDMDDRDANVPNRKSVYLLQVTLRRNGLSWVTKNNAKVAVHHVLSAVCPGSL